tara:strand:+ start:414 stop:605 length:192 start_codon:yes stop_codon:yes gene_type:complete
MIAEIVNGVLTIVPESPTEEYALNTWQETAIVMQVDVARNETYKWIGSKIAVITPNPGHFVLL